jgi:hypothetical protein
MFPVNHQTTIIGVAKQLGPEPQMHAATILTSLT